MRVTGARSFIPLPFRLRKRSFFITATPALLWVNCRGCFFSFNIHHVISIIPVLPSSNVSHDFVCYLRAVLVVFCKELRILLASFGGRSSFGLGEIGSKFPSSHLLATPNPTWNLKAIHLEMVVSIGWWTKSFPKKCLKITKHPLKLVV